MGRLPAEMGVNKKGLWTPEEDLILVTDIQNNGAGNWSSVPSRTGLKRDPKSCRLRWQNYLRPGLNRGSFTSEEERIIIQLQAVMGNKWAGIAHYLPGRTDNDIKNFWNAYLKKKVDGASGSRNADNQNSDSSKRRWEKSLQENAHSAKKALSDALIVSPQASVDDQGSISLSPAAPGLGSPLSVATAPLLSSSLMSFKPPRGWNHNISHQQLMIHVDNHQFSSQAAPETTRAYNQDVVSLAQTASTPYSRATLVPAPGLGSPLPMSTTPLPLSEILNFNPPHGWTQNASQQQPMIPADDHQLHNQASQITRASTCSKTTEPYVFSCDKVAIWLQSWNKQIPKSRVDNVAARHPPLVPAAPAVLGRELGYFPSPAVATAASSSWQNEANHISQLNMPVPDDQAHWPFY